MKTWIINTMDSKLLEGTLTDVVSIIHWTRQYTQTVNDKQYSTWVYGAYNCPPPNPNDFIPYQDLTQSDVDGWLDSGLDVASIDLTLDSQMEQLINPPYTQLPLPFSPTPQPTPNIV